MNAKVQSNRSMRFSELQLERQAVLVFWRLNGWFAPAMMTQLTDDINDIIKALNAHSININCVRVSMQTEVSGAN